MPAIDDLVVDVPGTGCHLRPVRLADAPALETEIRSFDVARMLARVPHPYPRGSAEGWIEMSRACLANGVALNLTIVADQPIGVVGFGPFGAEADLGYWLAQSRWGRGIMTEAVRAAIAHAFENGAETIVSGVFADNPASLRVQQKLGFDVVGESRVYSLARKARVAHIDTRLTREQFRDAA